MKIQGCLYHGDLHLKTASRELLQTLHGGAEGGICNPGCGTLAPMGVFKSGPGQISSQGVLEIRTSQIIRPYSSYESTRVIMLGLDYQNLLVHDNGSGAHKVSRVECPSKYGLPSKLQMTMWRKFDLQSHGRGSFKSESTTWGHFASSFYGIP